MRLTVYAALQIRSFPQSRVTRYLQPDTVTHGRPRMALLQEYCAWYRTLRYFQPAPKV